MATPTASSANRVALRYADEIYTRAGVARGGGAGWAILPSEKFDTCNYTGESLAHEKNTERSKNIRSDRQMAPAVQVSTRAAGDTQHELNVTGEQPVFIGAALAGTLAYETAANWQSDQSEVGSSNLTFTGGGANTIAKAGATFDEKFVVGQFIRVIGTSDNGTNAVPKYFSIKSVDSATQITTNEALTTENNTSGTVSGTVMRNGTVARSFYLEKDYADVGSTFLQFPGAMINTWELSFEAGGIAQSRFTWLAEKGLRSASTASNATPQYDPATHNPLNATSNVTGIYEGGSALTSCVLGVTLRVQNGLRERPAVGRVGSCGIGYGPCDVTGTVRAYFDGLTTYAKFEDHTATSLRLLLVDSGKGAYMFTVPSMKYTVGRVLARSGDSDVIAEFEFAADISGTSTGQIAPGCMIQVDRWAAF